MNSSKCCEMLTSPRQKQIGMKLSFRLARTKTNIVIRLSFVRLPLSFILHTNGCFDIIPGMIKVRQGSFINFFYNHAKWWSARIAWKKHLHQQQQPQQRNNRRDIYDYAYFPVWRCAGWDSIGIHCNGSCYVSPRIEYQYRGSKHVSISAAALQRIILLLKYGCRRCHIRLIDLTHYKKLSP